MAALFGTHCAGGAEEFTSSKKISLQELNDGTKMFEEVSEIFVLRSLYNEMVTFPASIHPFGARFVGSICPFWKLAVFRANFSAQAEADAAPRPFHNHAINTP